MTSTLTALKRVLAVIAITTLLSALTDNSASASPTLTPDLMSARELQNALALYQSLQVKVKAGEKLDAGSVRRLEALRVTILARGGQLPTVGVVEPVSRLIVWSEVLQKQLPVRNGTRILVEGEIATVTETLSPYQVQFLRTGGGNGLLTGRREYPSVYATIEVRGIELKHSSIFNGDGVFANGVHVGVVEAIFRCLRFY